jgi:diadenosine tetraphosphate (Ap4A) HIT family hydrolase/predicted house-cleaning noncanonical NTP pyrophosphatase (MazG superfamily)
MKIKSFKVEKLIRDQVPSILRAKGIMVHERVMEQEEFIQRLKDKLLEEGEEVRQTQNAEELLEELADVLEVIQALSSATGLSMTEIERKRIEKRQVKGGFEDKIFNHRIDIEENNQAIAYYLNKSTQYPQTNHDTHKPDCLFCQMSCGEKETSFFAKFQHCYVIKDQFPVSPGHILIIPYQHTENWFTATEEVRLDIMKALISVKERLDVDYDPHGYNIGANCGKVAGQSVMHLHVHLIPRYLGDMEDPKGGVRGVIPSKQKY